MRRALLSAVLLTALLTVAPAAHATLTGTALNRIADGPQQITFGFVGFTPVYTPDDLAVAPGVTTWSGDLVAHPLRFDGAAAAGASTGALAERDLTPGVYRYYCAIHGGPGGLGMAGRLYVAGPDAVLKAVPAAPAAAGPVTLDASGTDFVDTTVNGAATYEFDAEADGTYETSGASPTAQVTYGLGTHTVRLRVTDDDGRTDVTTATIVVGPTSTPAGGTTSGGGGPGAGAPGASGDPADATAPALTTVRIPAVRRRALGAGPLRLAVGTLSERAVVSASLRLQGRTIGRAASRSVAGGPLRVTVRLSAAGRRALGRVRTATLSLRLVLTDAAGNRTVVTRPVRLRR